MASCELAESSCSSFRPQDSSQDDSFFRACVFLVFDYRMMPKVTGWFKLTPNNNQQQLTTNNQQPTTNNNQQQPTTNNQQPTTTNNQQQPTTNNNQQQPTITNNQQPTPTTTTTTSSYLSNTKQHEQFPIRDNHKKIITRAPEVRLTRWLVQSAAFFKTNRSSILPRLKYDEKV